MTRKEIYAQLKVAAAQCDAAATQLDEAEKAVKTAEATAAAKVKEVQTKVASVAKDEVEIARLAKMAAAKIREAGLLSSEAQADQFASQIRDPRIALQKMAEVAGYVHAPKLGSVVKSGSVSASETPTADEAYETRARKHLARLGG
jgi:hypothetical protein